MSEKIYLNRNWRFMDEFDESLVRDDKRDEQLKKIGIPHTCQETPLHYFDESSYQKVSGYVRSIFAKEEWRDQHVLLTFEGNAHDSEVYLNGEKIGSHHCGYTAFTVDLAPYLHFGEENRLVVRVDSRESLNVPPFGFVIDYMTYGGIYRDVYLEIRNKVFLEDVFVYTEVEMSHGKCTNRAKLITETAITRECGFIRKRALRQDAECRVNLMEEKSEEEKNEHQDQQLENYLLRQSICRKGHEKKVVFSDKKVSLDKTGAICRTEQKVSEVKLWDIHSPEQYELKTELYYCGIDGQALELEDSKNVSFGFRKAEFRKEGFYLNGKKLKLRGMNRHQSFPYVGYAMPASMQELDAVILKEELGLNAVRTSHYPQSQAFLNKCDELGLLVFMEIPGWQHIGDQKWKNQAVKNTADMVLQNRNHPAVILWGVRINESVDDDAFYQRTNAMAHFLDPSRQTGGVRCYKKSHLLEDVYTYNDFIHDGKKKGCERKADVTSDMDKAYLISEYNGHMFPTKTFDCEEHLSEQVLRHANVLDAVNAHKDIAGCFAWCMFDYNTHKDFGSGDRICYHGVMDMFRNPKPAADVYASQQETYPVLDVVSSMDIGEHPGCCRGDSYVLTNADSVRMYKNDKFIKEYQSFESPYKNMKHGPILLDDFVGELLEKEEGFSHKKAELIRQVLNEAARCGVYRMPFSTYLKAGKLMLLYHMKPSEAVELYNKYVGNWGGESTVYRFEAIKDGKVVQTVYRQPMKKAKIEAKADHQKLVENSSYDVALVRIHAVDEYGNTLRFSNDPIRLDTSGPIEIIGPNVISLNGGMTGTYVRSIGVEGEAQLQISMGKEEKVTISFQVENA